MRKWVVSYHTGFDDWMYATHENPFTYNSEPILFDSQEAAVQHAKQYTESVVEVYQSVHR
jgi:hypothetical protein